MKQVFFLGLVIIVNNSIFCMKSSLFDLEKEIGKVFAQETIREGLGCEPHKERVIKFFTMGKEKPKEFLDLINKAHFPISPVQECINLAFNFSGICFIKTLGLEQDKKAVIEKRLSEEEYSKKFKERSSQLTIDELCQVQFDAFQEAFTKILAYLEK